MRLAVGTLQTTHMNMARVETSRKEAATLIASGSMRPTIRVHPKVAQRVKFRYTAALCKVPPIL
jgi:hypothetical protein